MTLLRVASILRRSQDQPNEKRLEYATQFWYAFHHSLTKVMGETDQYSEHIHYEQEEWNALSRLLLRTAANELFITNAVFLEFLEINNAHMELESAVQSIYEFPGVFDFIDILAGGLKMVSQMMLDAQRIRQYVLNSRYRHLYSYFSSNHMRICEMRITPNRIMHLNQAQARSFEKSKQGKGIILCYLADRYLLQGLWYPKPLPRGIPACIETEPHRWLLQLLRNNKSSSIQKKMLADIIISKGDHFENNLQRFREFQQEKYNKNIANLQNSRENQSHFRACLPFQPSAIDEELSDEVILRYTSVKGMGLFMRSQLFREDINMREVKSNLQDKKAENSDAPFIMERPFLIQLLPECVASYCDYCARPLGKIRIPNTNPFPVFGNCHLCGDEPCENCCIFFNKYAAMEAVHKGEWRTCSGCSLVNYCSEKCERIAGSLYHFRECSGMSRLRGLGSVAFAARAFCTHLAHQAWNAQKAKQAENSNDDSDIQPPLDDLNEIYNLEMQRRENNRLTLQRFTDRSATMYSKMSCMRRAGLVMSAIFGARLMMYLQMLDDRDLLWEGTQWDNAREEKAAFLQHVQVPPVEKHEQRNTGLLNIKRENQINKSSSSNEQKKIIKNNSEIKEPTNRIEMREKQLTTKQCKQILSDFSFSDDDSDEEKPMIKNDFLFKSFESHFKNSSNQPLINQINTKKTVIHAEKSGFNTMQTCIEMVSNDLIKRDSPDGTFKNNQATFKKGKFNLSSGKNVSKKGIKKGTSKIDEAVPRTSTTTDSDEEYFEYEEYELLPELCCMKCKTWCKNPTIIDTIDAQRFMPSTSLPSAVHMTRLFRTGSVLDAERRLTVSLLKFMVSDFVNGMILRDDFWPHRGQHVPAYGENVPHIGRAMYAVGSLVNHSCQPNCERVFVRDRLLIRPKDGHILEDDEEVTISYLDEEPPNEMTRERLRRSYGFMCECKSCIITDNSPNSDEPDCEMLFDLPPALVDHTFDETMNRIIDQISENFH